MQSTKKMEKSIPYNRAKVWQLILFTLNDVAFNVYFFAMGFLSYYANGVVGISVTFVAYLLTAMRIFDGITDPLIGVLLDRTDTKFGKFRPFMVLGNGIMAVSVLLMFFTTSSITNDLLRIIYFILIYAIYIIGYTCQGAATRAAQSVLTNDPSQRPMVSVISGTGCSLVGVFFQVFIASFLMVKYSGVMNEFFFRELMLVAIAMSAILTLFAVVGIWEKDKPEYYRIGKTKSINEKIKFKDYIDVIKGNKGLQMLILAASTDKLASVIANNAIVGVMIFGIICGNYQISAQLSMITLVPTLIILFGGAILATKMGQRKAVTIFSMAAIIFQSIILAIFIFGDPTQIGTLGPTSIIFYISYILLRGCMGVPGSLVIPMIADCSDYEVYRSGRYVPGLMGTLFSSVDKVFSALGNTIVGLLIATIGYNTIQPSVNDPLTSQVFALALFLWCGLPIIGWICSLIGMKLTPLTKEKMREVEEVLAKTKVKESN